MNSIRLLKVGLGDAPQLQAISRQTFEETFAESNTAADMEQYMDQALSLSKLTEEINDPRSAFYFAVRGDQVLGYIKFNTGGAQKENVDPNAVELERIYVLREYLGDGIGKFLLDQALSLAVESGAHYIWLGVWEKNERAIRFYQKNGFKEFGTHPFQLGQDLQTDILMKRPTFSKIIF